MTTVLGLNLFTSGVVVRTEAPGKWDGSFGFVSTGNVDRAEMGRRVAPEVW